MPEKNYLREVDRKILQKQEGDLVCRFFVGSPKRLYLHLWQNIKTEKDQSQNFGIEKFQLSNDTWAFEWKKKSTLKFAHLSEEEDPHKIKASPLMIMQGKTNDKAKNYMLDYLNQDICNDIPEVNFVRNIFKGS